MVKFMILGLGATFLLGCSRSALALGGKNGKEDDLPEMPKGKDAVDLARAGFAQAAGDIGLMADLMKDLKDPEVMKEVEKLMNDKEFKKEMEALTGSQEWKKGLADAQKLLSDPGAVAAMQKQAEEYLQFLAAGPGKDGARDFQMAIDAAGKVARDPGFMRDTLEMMKDPEIYKQVQETMRNPEFQEQMKLMMESPNFKRQIEEAGANMEDMLKSMKAAA